MSWPLLDWELRLQPLFFNIEKIIMTSIIKRFMNSVNQFPDKPALYVDSIYYTYADLYGMALSIANKLRDYSAQRCVILSKKNCIAYAAILGVLMADKTYVPLNPVMPDAINLNLLESIDTDLLLTDNPTYSLLKKLSARVHILDCHVAERAPRNDIYHDMEAQNKYAYLLFTSGSTSQPKGVMISHANVLTYVDNIIQRSAPCAEDRFSQLSDLTFDFSVHDLFVAWSVGACVYSISNQHLIHWQHFMEQHRLTFWASVPSTIQFLHYTGQLQSDSMQSLKYSFFCGEILSHAHASQWKLAAPQSVIDNLYGPTEATVACTGYQWHPEDDPFAAVPIGFPFPEQEILILDGELCLSGPQVTHFYWRNEELTQQRFFLRDHRLWYRTRDLVSWDEHRGLIYQGRLDDQFKIRGRCVTKLEIESAIRQIAETPSVAVLIRPDQLANCIVAFVSHSALSVKQILKTARGILPDYMVPQQMIELATLPLNRNGKIDYIKLLELFHE